MKTTCTLIRLIGCIAALTFFNIMATAQSIKTVPMSSTIITDMNHDGSEKLEFSVDVDWPVGSYSVETTKKMRRAIIDNLSNTLDSMWGISATEIKTYDLPTAIYKYNHLLVQEIKDWMAIGGEIILSANFSHSHKDYACFNTCFNRWLNNDAHMYIDIQYMVLNSKTGDVVTLDDLFRPGYQVALQNILDQQKVYLMQNDEEEVERDGYFSDHYTLTENFYIDAQGITFVYNGNGHHNTLTIISIPWHKISYLLK